MKASEVKKKLKKAGCYKLREGKNHEIWYSPITNKKFPISRHDSEEMKPKTWDSIQKQSGLK